MIQNISRETEYIKFVYLIAEVVEKARKIPVARYYEITMPARLEAASGDEFFKMLISYLDKQVLPEKEPLTNLIEHTSPLRDC